MSLLPDVEFIIIDKRSGWHGLRALRAQLRARHFDLLLHMQLAMRASIASAFVHAPIRLGFDRPRARELQWVFTNRSIEPRANEHVLDSFQGFIAALGIEAGPPH